MRNSSVDHKNRLANTAARWTALCLGLTAASYATYVGVTWRCYGKAKKPRPDDADSLLDQFMPKYEIVERHKVHVCASAPITFSAAAEMELEQSTPVRAIFKGREWLMGSEELNADHPRGFLSQVKSLGWGVLAEIPNREVVMGAVTKPWLANPVFRTLPPSEFTAFSEPDYVKIIWSLRVDPLSSGESVFRTETRATTTDAAARAKFRRYWALLSPGIILIRLFSLRLVKTDAERRARNQSRR
jgi:hypothetical protein